MALKLLVPVLPSERFYDAVVAAGDILAREGGTVTFLFTQVRPPPEWEEKQDVGFDGELEPDVEATTDDTLDEWQQQMVSGMQDATDLLLERGVDDGQVTYLFADDELPASEAIAGEAAAGAFDMVVLPRAAFNSTADEIVEGSLPTDIAEALKELQGDGVKLVVA